MIDCQHAITGVILAGGRAERMGGQDKGLLLLTGEALIAHSIRRLQPQVAELLISANRNLAIYQSFGCRVISDDPDVTVHPFCQLAEDPLSPMNEGEGTQPLYPDVRFRGPLAGILAALNAAKTPYVLTAPCDSPWLPRDYAERMAAALTKGASVSVAVHEGSWQPVFALLPVALRDDLAEWLATGRRGVGRWLQRFQPVRVEFADCPALFRNLNTPEDWAAWAP